MFSIYLEGFFLGASLIMAIGLQNAFILRQGLKQNHVLAAVLTASISDTFLITFGVLGFGQIMTKMPELMDFILWGAISFLFFYGCKSFYNAFKPSILDPSNAKNMDSTGLKEVILSLLAVSWLNPHALLDTVVLLGSASTIYIDIERFIFGFGAVCASFVWFFSLGYGAKFLTPLFARPRAWQILDILIALVMWGIATKLLFSF